MMMKKQQQLLQQQQQSLQYRSSSQKSENTKIRNNVSSGSRMQKEQQRASSSNYYFEKDNRDASSGSPSAIKYPAAMMMLQHVPSLSRQQQSIEHYQQAPHQQQQHQAATFSLGQLKGKIQLENNNRQQQFSLNQTNSILRSHHSTIFADTPMINSLNPHATKVSGLISQLNHTASMVEVSPDNLDTEPDQQNPTSQNVSKMAAQKNKAMKAQYSFKQQYRRQGGSRMSISPNPIPASSSSPVAANAGTSIGIIRVQPKQQMLRKTQRSARPAPQRFGDKVNFGGAARSYESSEGNAGITQLSMRRQNVGYHQESHQRPFVNMTANTSMKQQSSTEIIKLSLKQPASLKLNSQIRRIAEDVDIADVQSSQSNNNNANRRQFNNSDGDDGEDRMIFNERPLHKHNESSVSQQMLQSIQNNIDTSNNGNSNNISRITGSSFHEKNSQSLVMVAHRKPQQKQRQNNQQVAAHDVCGNDGDETVVDICSDDCNTASDRYLINSAQSMGEGVNVPMNSLPKLSRHRKSDLLANELEGNPQKPSGVSVHFSSKRKQMFTPSSQKQDNNGLQNRNKVVDSGITQSKSLLASQANSVHAPEMTEQRASMMSPYNISPLGADGLHMKSNSISEGSINKFQYNKLDNDTLLQQESLLFNRISMLEREQNIKAPRGQYAKQSNKQMIHVRKIQQKINSATLTPANEKTVHRPQSQRIFQVTGKNNITRQLHNDYVFGDTEHVDNRNETQARVDALCLEDLTTTSPLLKPPVADSPLNNAEELASSNGEQAAIKGDENVGDITPQKLVYANLSASENLSLSQYLSNSLQQHQSVGLKQRSSMNNNHMQMMTKSSCLLTNNSHHSGTNNIQPHNPSKPTNRNQFSVNSGGVSPQKRKPNNNPKLVNSANKSTQQQRKEVQQPQYRLPASATLINFESLTKKQQTSFSINHLNQNHNNNNSELTASPAPKLIMQQSMSLQKLMQINSASKKNNMKNFPNEDKRHLDDRSSLSALNKIKKSLILYDNSGRETAHVQTSKMNNYNHQILQKQPPVKQKRVPFNKAMMSKNQPRAFQVNHQQMSAGQSKNYSNKIIDGQLKQLNQHPKLQGVDDFMLDQEDEIDARQFIGQSALQRGLSPPAHLKKLSQSIDDEIRSSSTGPQIQETPRSDNRRSVGNSQLNNQRISSAYMLKQYISDVNKINSKNRQQQLVFQQKSKIREQIYMQNKRETSQHQQTQLHPHQSSVQKPAVLLIAGGSSTPSQNRLQQPHNFDYSNSTTPVTQQKKQKRRTTMPPGTQLPQTKLLAHKSSSQLTTQNSSSLLQTQQQQHQNQRQLQQQQASKNLAKNYLKSSKRINISNQQVGLGGRSTSPQDSSNLSRVLSYNPSASRQSLQQRPGSGRQTLLSTLTSQPINSRIGGLLNGGGRTFTRQSFNQNNTSKELSYTGGHINIGGIYRLPVQSLALPRVFRVLLSFLDYMSLFTFIQTRKDYRWDVSTRGKGYQPNYYWVHKEIRKRMKQILLKDGGLRSTVERRNFWIYRSKLNKLSKNYPCDHYKKLVDEHFNLNDSQTAENFAQINEIGKDIGRTFPDLQFFSKNQPGQLKLHRLLTAVSAFRHQSSNSGEDSQPLGYTQGMNFIAGTALVHLQQHEENTFWFLISVLCEHNFLSVFNFEVHGTFRKLCFQLEVLTQVNLPELHAHLAKHKIPTDIYASNWFITMFTNDLPFDMAANVLDVFLLEGDKGLLRIALSLLSFFQTELLSLLHYDELMVFLSHPHAREQIVKQLDQSWLLRTSYGFKITQGLLAELNRLFIIREKLASSSNNISQITGQKDSSKVLGLTNNNQCLLDEFKENFQHFTQLRLCKNEPSNMVKKHEWHVLMLGPDDVDDLMYNQGLQTEQIEQLRLFYNMRIKDKGLDTVLTQVEQAFIEEAKSSQPEVAVPKKLNKPTDQISSNSGQQSSRGHVQIPLRKKIIKYDDVDQNFDSNPTSDADEYDLASQTEPPRIAMAGSSISQGDGDISLQSTPRMRTGLLPSGPLIIRRQMQLQSKLNDNSNNTIENSMVKIASATHLSHKILDKNDDNQGSTSKPEASTRQTASLFGMMGFDISTKIESLFRPLSLSPKHGLLASRQISQQMATKQNSGRGDSVEASRIASQALYDSVGYESRPKINMKKPKQTKQEESYAYSSRKVEKSKTTVVPQQLQLYPQRQQKTLTPQMMLSGGDDQLVNSIVQYSDYNKQQNQDDSNGCSEANFRTHQVSETANRPLVSQINNSTKTPIAGSVRPRSCRNNDNQLLHSQRHKKSADQVGVAAATNGDISVRMINSGYHIQVSQQPKQLQKKLTKSNTQTAGIHQSQQKQSNKVPQQQQKALRGGTGRTSLIKSINQTQTSLKQSRPITQGFQQQLARVAVPNSFSRATKQVYNNNGKRQSAAAAAAVSGLPSQLLRKQPLLHRLSNSQVSSFDSGGDLNVDSYAEDDDDDGSFSSHDENVNMMPGQHKKTTEVQKESKTSFTSSFSKLSLDQTAVHQFNPSQSAAFQNEQHPSQRLPT